MNTIAFPFALAGLIVFGIFYFLSRRVKNNFLKGLVQVLGIVFGFIVPCFITAASKVDLEVLIDAVGYLLSMLFLIAFIDLVIRRIRKKT